MRDEELIATLQRNPVLRRCLRDALAAHGTPDKRVSRDTSDCYIARAYHQVLLEHGHAMPSDETALCGLLCPALRMLVALDERILLQKIESTDWPALTKKLLALTAHRHGSRINRYGASADDYVQEAIALFLGRRRHFPVDRPELTLFKFLARTIDSLFDHASKKMRKDGEPLRIVYHTDMPRSDEWLEEHIPSPAPDQEKEMIAAENVTRFLHWLEDDIPLQMYARLRVSEFCASASSCAYELQTTVSDIRNRERRFRRRLRQFRTAPPK